MSSTNSIHNVAEALLARHNSLVKEWRSAQDKIGELHGYATGLLHEANDLFNAIESLNKLLPAEQRLTIYPAQEPIPL